VSQIPPFDPELDGLEPKYVRLADHIQAEITADVHKAGSRMRSERDLAVEYGVSYGTMRSTARVLRERGLIVTSPGRGTYIVGTAPADPGPAGPDEDEGPED
jgi:GntR family transcriptional regulator